MPVTPFVVVMAARTLNRFFHGIKRSEAATPERFTVERANEIFRLCREKATQGPYSDQYKNVMTNGEYAFVLAVWDSNPNGNSSFDSTFHYIRNGELDRDVTNGTVTIK